MYTVGPDLMCGTRVIRCCERHCMCEVSQYSGGGGENDGSMRVNTKARRECDCDGKRSAHWLGLSWAQEMAIGCSVTSPPDLVSREAEKRVEKRAERQRCHEQTRAGRTQPAWIRWRREWDAARAGAAGETRRLAWRARWRKIRVPGSLTSPPQTRPLPQAPFCSPARVRSRLAVTPALESCPAAGAAPADRRPSRARPPAVPPPPAN